jgi:hypothetical protein
LLLACFFPGVGLAWGRLGHQIVALIAERELTPEAKVKVAALLAVEVPRGSAPADVPAGLSDLAISSTWADEILSERRETGPWHYVDIPVTEPAYVAERDCPAGACVIAQINRLRGVLQSPATLPPERAEALRFLVHLVGDVHQPLHAACMVLPLKGRRAASSAQCGGQPNSDRGGNEIRVRFGDLGIDLHRVWDTELIYELRGKAPAVADRLAADITASQRQTWPGGSAEDWANESHRLAQQVAYGLLPKEKRIVIPLRYESEARQTVETQLKRAGLRLARLLNESLGSSQ